MILHLFKNDLRRSRVLLSLWGALVLIQSLLAVWTIHPGDQVVQYIYIAVLKLVPVFQGLLLVVVIPFLVHEEPLVGTTAFWFTRPIRRSTLLKSKAFFAIILIALPLFAEIAVLAANGITGHDISLAIPEIVMSELKAVVFIGLLAAITPNFGRFAAVGAGLVVSLLLVSFGISWIKLLHISDVGADTAFGVTRAKSAGIASDIVTIIAGSGIIIYQYLTRKTKTSVILGVVVVVATLAIQSFWRWDFFKEIPVSKEGIEFASNSITATFRQSSVYDVPSLRGIVNQRKKLNVRFAIAGLPEGDVASPEHIEPKLFLADGTEVKTQAETNASVSFSTGVDSKAVEFALGGVRVLNGMNADGGTNMPVLTMDAKDYRAYTDTPLKLTASMSLEIGKYVVVSEIPVTVGANFTSGSKRESISAVLQEGTGVQVVVDVRAIKLLFDAKSEEFNPSMYGIWNGKDVFLLCNRKRGEAVLQKQSFNPDFQDMISNIATRLTRSTMKFSYGSEPFRLAPDMTPAWLADATLVHLRLQTVGHTSKDVTVDKLRLNATNFSSYRPEARPAFDPSIYARIQLPQNPTRAQVKEYVDALIASSQRDAYTGPLTEKLKAVGHDNLDVLLETLENVSQGSYSPALEQTIEGLAQKDDEAKVLPLLATHTQLVTVVVKLGWTKDAHDTLIAQLNDPHQRFLPREWIRAVAMFKDPSTYPALKAYLIRTSNRQETFNAIRKLPDLDLTDTVAAAWTQANLEGPNEIRNMEGIASESGHLDALARVIDTLRDEDKEPGAEVKRCETYARRVIPHRLDDDAAIVQWFDTNRDKLVFDKETGKFTADGK